MKKSMIVLMALFSGSTVFADGFVCTSLDGVLTAKAYNHTLPTNGTRVPSRLILSDNTVARGNKTIATFEDFKGTLSGGSFTYWGNVDLRFSGTSRKGEYIGGTRLGELDAVILNVDHDYAQIPLRSGDLVKGTLTLIKRDRTRFKLEMECERYLKN